MTRIPDQLTAYQLANSSGPEVGHDVPEVGEVGHDVSEVGEVGHDVPELGEVGHDVPGVGAEVGGISLALQRLGKTSLLL